MDKISYDEYLAMARNPKTDDDELLEYSIIVRGEGGFDFELKANPERVEMTDEDHEFENAMKIGNGIARYRRQAAFRAKVLFGSDKPILVSEGDSWFQFPFLIKDVIDRLDDDYLIWSVGAAGDTADNMVFGPEGKYKQEYMKALRKHRKKVKGFLFSGAGNDIIGIDPVFQKPVLLLLLKDFNGDESDVEGHINLPLLKQKFDFLESAYRTVMANVRAEFNDLPIVFHGYDYPYAYPANDADNRDPVHADKDEWLGSAFEERSISSPKLRREILIYLIDRLYVMLDGLAGDSSKTNVWIVNCRKALPKVDDWVDEIHATSDGYKEVGKRFENVLKKAL